MTDAEIARQRLQNQHLVATSLTNPVEVVRSLGAVQSQDYANAKWAIGQRTNGITDVQLEHAVTTGALIRTHVLRPTWHFVAADDIRWLLALTAPRVSAAMAYYNRVLELDARGFRKSNTALTRALRDGKQLTRPELTLVLARSGIDVSTGQRVGHLLMQAELDGVICSGGRRGKQFTYALFDERVPTAGSRDRDESLHDLTQRYFATRGPATLQDFSWWSGLTIADAKRGVTVAAAVLERLEHEGRTHWIAPASQSRTAERKTAHLLPNYDEYFIGFKNRRAIGERLRRTVTNPRVDALMGHVVVVDGQLVGGWRRALRKRVELELDLLIALTATERKLVLAAAERFGEFVALPVSVSGTVKNTKKAETRTGKERRDPFW